jgi:hypothetical protein
MDFTTAGHAVAAAERVLERNIGTDQHQRLNSQRVPLVNSVTLTTCKGGGRYWRIGRTGAKDTWEVELDEGKAWVSHTANINQSTANPSVDVDLSTSFNLVRLTVNGKVLVNHEPQ